MELSSIEQVFNLQIYINTGFTGWEYTFHWHSDLTHLSSVQSPWIKVIKLKHFEDITLKEVNEIPSYATDLPLELAMPFHPVSQR